MLRPSVISDFISTLDLDQVYEQNALLLTLQNQRAEMFRLADLEHARLLEDFRCSIRDELAMGDEGCPNTDGNTADDLPIETWVGGTIRAVAVDSFVLQIRDNNPGIHSPNMVCNFGGEKRDGEKPSETYVREYDEEFLGSNIFEYSLLDILRIYPVRTSWGGVIRVVFDLIIPTIPEPLRIGEGTVHFNSLRHACTRFVASSKPCIARMLPKSVVGEFTCSTRRDRASS